MKRLTEIIQSSDIKLKKGIKALENSLVAFSDITGVPVTFFSVDRHVLWEVNREKKFCISNSEYFDVDSNCMLNLKSAMDMSYSLGDVYICVCNTGLINMCYAFVLNGKLQGYFNAGPVIMGKNKIRAVRQFYERIPQETIDIPMFMSIAGDSRMHSPMEVTHLSTLYLNSIRAPFAEANSTRQQFFMEQSKIGTKIVELKKKKIEIEYPLMQEQALVNSIWAGDVEKSKKLFSEYLGELMVFEGGNLSVIRLRMLTLFSKLIRERDESKKEHDGPRQYMQFSQLESINTAETFSEVMTNGKSFVEMLASDVSESVYSGDSEIIKETLLYIRNNFTENISLKSVAETVHANHTYLSTLFKKEVTVSMTEYINGLRLEKACDALVHTNDSIMDIAMSCGFRDSSYFTKLFKAMYQMKPKEYREQMK